jgi:hypothetical protein
MEIYTHKQGETGLIFRSKRTSHYINFKIILNNNKPELSAWWNGHGGLGGKMDLNKPKVWSLFLRELKDAVMKNTLVFID